MDCRHIDETEVMEILQNGKLNYEKIEEDKPGKTYPLEGITHDKQHVRIVFAPKEEEVVVVTVIDLEKDWECDCKTHKQVHCQIYWQLMDTTAMPRLLAP